MANSLIFTLVGNDKLSPAMTSAGKSADNLGSKLSGLGKIAGKALGVAAAGGILALGAAFVSGAKDAAVFEVLGRKTAAVIKSTGNVAKLSVDGVKKLAASLENMSGVDENLIINAQNVLATFTKVRNETGLGNDIFNQGAKAALDMSVALGTDLQSAALQVGKALNDPIRGTLALRRAGVQLTEAQVDQIKKMVEAGNVMGAQKVILRELTTEFGGAARAAGDTFTGKIARAKDALADMARDISAKALPKLGDLADWVATTGVPKFQGFITFFGSTLVPRIAAEWGKLKGKMDAALPTIDLSRLGEKIMTQARNWGQEVIVSVKTGLDTGDWSGLGRSVGDGIVRALAAAGRVAGRIGEAIGDLLGKVDWFQVGKAVGLQAPSFIIGFLDSLLDGIIKVARAHPVAFGLVIGSIIFAPARFLKPLVKVLEKIPIVGRLAAWLLTSLNSLGGHISRGIGFIGHGFLAGFRRIFPGVGEGFAKGLALLPIRLGVMAIDLQLKALRMMQSLAGAIGRGIFWVTARIGELIGRMLKPFARAGGWLINAGVNFVTGLLRGVLSVSRTIGRWILDNVALPAIRAFGTAGSWLINVGGNVISGLKSGVVNTMKGIGSWVKSRIVDPIVVAVKEFFKIDSPSKVFEGIGGNLIAGLFKGMGSGVGGAVARKVFGDMPSALRALVSKGLVSVQNLPKKALDALANVQNVVVPPGLLQRAVYQGQVFDLSTLRKIRRAEGILGRAMNITQGSYERASSFSGSTHTGGGVFDVVGGNLQRISQVLRSLGFASWVRDPSQGPWPPHVHAVEIGNALAAASAKRQVADFLLGGDGLGRIRGFRHGGWLLPGMTGFNETNRPELVSNVDQIRAAMFGGRRMHPDDLAAIVTALRNGRPVEVNNHFPAATGAAAEEAAARLLATLESV